MTDSERYLAKLCENTFLSLWSYPNTYTDEGKKSEKGDGKELCDLLVVFKNHVIIFSDKDIQFKNTGDLHVDWSRWVRRAVLNSAAQVYGAEKWILENPERIFLDSKCKTRFPVYIPNKNNIIIHRILVARNATKRFREYVDDPGTLIIKPDVIGKDHENMPFHIGTIDKGKGLIHILDDVALDILLMELDTISDFTEYLQKKENFISSGQLLTAAGEEELLAFYLASSKQGEDPDFKVEAGVKAIIDVGHYKWLTSLPQYKKGKEVDRQSYAIDSLIEHFAKYALDNNHYYTTENTFDGVVIGLRELAAEKRVARRIIANAFFEKLRTLEIGQRGVRAIQSPTNEKVAYIFIIEPIPTFVKDYDEYRDYRRWLVIAYCQSVKLLMPNIDIIIGIGIDPPGNGGSEDMVYIDTSSWTEDDYTDAKKIRNELGFFKEENVIKYQGIDYQYPLPQKR